MTREVYNTLLLLVEFFTEILNAHRVCEFCGDITSDYFYWEGKPYCKDCAMVCSRCGEAVPAPIISGIKWPMLDGQYVCDDCIEDMKHNSLEDEIFVPEERHPDHVMCKGHRKAFLTEGNYYDVRGWGVMPVEKYAHLHKLNKRNKKNTKWRDADVLLEAEVLGYCD